MVAIGFDGLKEDREVAKGLGFAVETSGAALGKAPPANNEVGCEIFGAADGVSTF